MTLDPAHSRTHPAFADRTRCWGFGLYALVSAIHIVSGVVGPDVIVFPTKLMLMPALAIAALWALRGSFDTSTATRAASVLFVALAFSWLGDGAGFFFPFLDDELPAMLLCFGLAHLAYILLFLRFLPRRAVPRWTLIYVVWWVLMVAVLWPSLGALAIAVALYGLVLGGTAVAATRGGAITTAGGAFFLASDTILALRLFLPDQTGLLAGPWVMLTYTIGQGLLAYGIVRLLREEPR